MRSSLISDTGASENKSSIFEALGKENCEIGVHGNVYAAVSFLQGLALQEVDHEKLDVLDPSFAVILTVRACKRVQP